jgi:hypothetical protein
MSQYGRPSKPAIRVSAKATYSKGARKKLIASKAKLDGIRAAIKRAITMGSLQPSDKLEFAQQAIEARLATAESRLETLQKSDDEGWEGLRAELEDAWEDLSHSINKLVARIKDESG